MKENMKDLKLEMEKWKEKQKNSGRNLIVLNTNIITM